MADHDLPNPTHNHGDDVPRGGRWVTCIAISVALIFAVAIAPQRWKVPLGALSMTALVIGVGMLMLSADVKGDESAPSKKP